MCAGAIVLARVPRVVFGACDPKAGACGSVLDVLGEPRLNHRPDVAGGLLGRECGALLSAFFARAGALAAERSRSSARRAPSLRSSESLDDKLGLRRAPWRGGRAVECGGLENRFGGFSSDEGSNPSPSVFSGAFDDLSRLQAKPGRVSGQ